MGKRYSDVFTKTGYGAFKALYPVFFLSPGCSPVLGKIRTSFLNMYYEKIIFENLFVSRGKNICSAAVYPLIKVNQTIAPVK